MTLDAIFHKCYEKNCLPPSPPTKSTPIETIIRATWKERISTGDRGSKYRWIQREERERENDGATDGGCDYFESTRATERIIKILFEKEREREREREREGERKRGGERERVKGERETRRGIDTGTCSTHTLCVGGVATMED